MKSTLGRCAFVLVGSFFLTGAGIAVAADKCPRTSKCGQDQFCGGKLCNCCPTYTGGGHTWRCTAGPCTVNNDDEDEQV